MRSHTHTHIWKSVHTLARSSSNTRFQYQREKMENVPKNKAKTTGWEQMLIRII